jgi:hypothetical protein
MLRPFNWELAALGHPLADINSGTEVRLLRTEGNPREPGSVLYAYDKWITADDRQPTPAWKTNNYLFCNEVGAKIALAPLAVKEGKPLHVGDTICYKGQGDWWCVLVCSKLRQMEVALMRDNEIRLPLAESNSKYLCLPRSVVNSNFEKEGPYTGRCQRCGSADLWDDVSAYGCNNCGALFSN